MAKLIYNGQEIADVTYTSGGGGGGGLPTFTETTIATGTSAGTLTFTDDYHDYDFVNVKCVNESSGEVTDYLCTPDMIDSIFDLPTDNEIAFNEFYTNQYTRYAKTSSTVWTLTGSRNLYISEVTGMACDNFTVTETEIYKKTSYDTQSRTISGTDLLDYDMFIVACSLAYTQPNSIPISKPIYTDSEGYLTIVNGYNTFTLIRITDTEMSSAPYHYVSGIKFT